MGLKIDTSLQLLPGAYTGFTIIEKEDTVSIATVDYESPAWNAGVRRDQQLLKINGEKASAAVFNKVNGSARPGDKIHIVVSANNQTKNIAIFFDKKTERAFKITPAENADPKQKQILESWLKG